MAFRIFYFSVQLLSKSYKIKKRFFSALLRSGPHEKPHFISFEFNDAIQIYGVLYKLFFCKMKIYLVYHEFKLLNRRNRFEELNAYA